MQIVRLVVRHIRLRLKKPFTHASYRRTETENVVIECHAADGSIGYGEGVPRDYVTGETVDSAWSTLKQADLLPLQSNFSSLIDAVSFFEQWSLPVPADDKRGIANNALRCAIELAFLDLAGKHFSTPLWKLPQLMKSSVAQEQSRVQYGVVMGSSQGWKLGMKAWLYKLYGFRTMKLKVGIPGQDDAARLKAVRKAVGGSVKLHVDANEAWTVTETLEWAKKLDECGVNWIEQPIPHEQMPELGKVASSLKLPIMLDESLCSMHDAEEALRQGYGNHFNLRLSKCGGFLKTLRLAEFAQQHGVHCQLGCQVGESAILSAAGRDFACAVGPLKALEGSFDSWLLKENIGTSDVTFGRGGWAPRLEGAGLGIDIDLQRLEAVTVKKEIILG